MPSKDRKRRLTPVPEPNRPEKRPDRKGAPAAGPDAPPDLSMIAEGLRPLAVSVGDLKFDPDNARKHPESNLEALRGSLAVYGQRRPVVVNRRTGHVEAGNGLLQAALSLGWQWVAAVYVDDDPGTAAGYAIADNRTSDLSEFDKDALAKLLDGVGTANDERLDKMISELAEEMKLIPADPGGGPPAPPPKEPNASLALECPSCGHRFDAPTRLKAYRGDDDD